MAIKINNNYCVSLHLCCFTLNVLIFYTQIHLTHVFAHESLLFYIVRPRTFWQPFCIAILSFYCFFFYIPHRIYFILFCFSCQDFLMILFRARKLNFTLDLSNFPPKTFISFYIQFSRYAFYLPPLPFPTYLHSKKCLLASKCFLLEHFFSISSNRSHE